jgi:hypothetical protein
VNNVNQSSLPLEKQYMEEDKRVVPWLPAYRQVEDDLQINIFFE